MHNDYPAAFFNILLNQLPYCLVWLIGLILAIVNWRRSPRPAQLTALAMTILLLESLVHSVLFAQILTSLDPIGSKLTVLNWVGMIVNALAFALLFWAIFGWRQTFSPRRFVGKGALEDTDLDEVERTGDPDTGIRKQPRRLED